MDKYLFKHIDIAYFVKFLLLLVLLYYFNIFYLGITDPKNYYSSFLDHYFNYIDWIKLSILYTANLIIHAFGINSYVELPRVIATPQGVTIYLEFACLGLGILSFWVAFIVAQKNTWQRKLYWCLGGIMAIWIINCLRIAILLIALQEEWPASDYIDHHDAFNLFAYAAILLLMYFQTKEDTGNVVDLPPKLVSKPL